MASIRFDVISIGTLARNRLWHEPQAVRTAHSTTTLIRTPDRTILVDPGLPGIALAARLFERTGLRPAQVDTVFVTCFSPAHRLGLDAFEHAAVLIHEPEQQAARQQIENLLGQAPEEDLDRRQLQADLELLNSMQPAEDSLARHIDLFPLPGYTPGNCGLLLAMPTLTVLVTGAAVGSQEHFVAGQVLPDCQDLQSAKRSLQEIYEIADLVVPGYDNLFVNPRSYGI